MTTTIKIPASIRHKNPGAMGLGKSAKLFGATKSTTLNDGAKNTIATFPTSVDGAGALFHLLWSNYTGLTVWKALHKWGDGATLERNGDAMKGRMRTAGYVASIERYTRFRENDLLTKELLEDAPRAIELGKAMTRHEAGAVLFPMTDAQWVEAHGEFMTVIRGGAILLDRKQPVVNLKPLELARTHLGEREIPGSDHNDFIVKCFADVGSKVRNDETAWCAVFVGAMLKRSQCAYLEGVMEAKKYLNYGHALDEPEVGCIVVFWRESPLSWKGHVAIVESFTATTITTIDGNQGNAVSRTTRPRVGRGSQVLGYRRPVANVVAAKEIINDESMQRKIVGGMTTVGAFLWSVWDVITNAATFVGEFVGVIPETAANATSAIATGQGLAQSVGVPWPITAGLAVAVACFIFGAYGTWKRKRKNDGDLTKAPYETDETPDDTAEEGDDFFAENVVNLEVEKAKRATRAKPKAAASTRKPKAKAKSRKKVAA